MNELVTIKKYNLVQVAQTLQVSAKTCETYANAMFAIKKFCDSNGMIEDLDSLKKWILSSKSATRQGLYFAASKKVFAALF